MRSELETEVGNDGPEASISDEDLIALALASDPNGPVDANAVPWDPWTATHASALPDWYMPRAIGARHGRGTRIVVCSLIVGFIVINAFGLCITSGFLTIA